MNAIRGAVPVRRSRHLRALGLVPWVLRESRTAAVIDQAPPATASHACVLVLPQDGPPRAQDVLGRALLAAGAPFARAPRLVLAEGRLAEPVPVAAAYLVFGEPQARALGERLSAETLGKARIVLVDAPSTLLEAHGKRALWTALRQLRRVLTQDAG